MTVPPSATRLYLIRHCQVADSTRGRCIGRTDVALSAGGVASAERLAGDFASVSVHAVYSSPLRRARETAAPLAAAAGCDVVIAPGLAEVDFGDFEGRAFDEIAAAQPDLYEQWMATPAQVRFPGGESFPDLKSRAVASVTGVLHRHPGAAVVLLSHAGPIRAILADLLELPDQAAFNLEVDHGAITEVEWVGAEPTVRRLNGWWQSADATAPPLIAR